MTRTCGSILAVFLAASCAGAAPGDAAQGLVQRVLPERASQFVLETIAADEGRDVFEIESRDGKIVLRGNDGVSIAAGFNWYLKYTARCEVSACGSQLDLPAVLPAAQAKVRIVATVPYRLMYNYCTFGYTMPWWGWERWQRELDELAMNGINLPFIMTGQEAVWINTFTQYGYTEQEIRRWLGSPAHFPWTFMQNMEQFGGELPAAWVPQRVALAQRIINRARELGMRTVLQGYYGMVPTGFAKRHPETRVIPQGSWCGFKRPDMLDPTDPIFAKLAATFMQEQEKLFGRAGFYMADPFHEGGNAAGVDRTDCGRRVFAAMCAADPQAVWIKMCWQTANADMLADIPADRVLALDLWAENRPFWPNGAFNGKAWAWCLLHNFGGNTDLNGDLAHLAKAFPETLANPKRGRLLGLAFTPEGHGQAPAVYALAQEGAWRGRPANLAEWLPAYLRRRYGTDSAPASRAWEGLLATVYGVPYRHETPSNAILQARPLRGEKARTWGNTRIPYEAADLVPAWEALLDAAPACAGSDAYRYDLADITRQVLGDLGRALYERIKTAAGRQDLAAFEANGGRFLALFTDLDTLLGTRREFLLGVWLADARSWGTTPAERKLYEWQARTLITLWDDNPGSELNDYANRQWNGLVKDYYGMRWALYVDALGGALRAGKPLDQAAFLAKLAAAEQAWTNADNPYPDTPTGDAVTVARALRAKYAPLLRDVYPPPFKPVPADVIGCWEYPAEGTTYLREFRADGALQSYRKSGSRLPWFDGFTWSLKGDKIVAVRPADGKVVTHKMLDKDTLDFASESFGKGRRVPVPPAAP